MCGHMYIHAMAHVQKLKDNLREMIFSFHCVDAVDWTQAVRLVEAPLLPKPPR